MSYVMKPNLADKSNYGNCRDTSSIQYVVMHYTGNDGDSDEANANYFKGAKFVRDKRKDSCYCRCCVCNNCNPWNWS